MFTTENLFYSHNDKAWMANYLSPESGYALEISVEGTPEAVDPDALALLVETFADAKKQIIDAKIGKLLFAPWSGSDQDPDGWSIEGVHFGHSTIYGDAYLLASWWFLHPDDTYGFYLAGYDKTLMSHRWPIMLARKQW